MAITSRTAAQSAKSTVAVTITWPRTMGRPPKAKAHADRPCASRPPPNSLVITAVSTVAAATANTAGTRIPHSVSPKSALAPRASSGVSGGWSTYPQAGRSMRK